MSLAERCPIRGQYDGTKAVKETQSCHKVLDSSFPVFLSQQKKLAFLSILEPPRAGAHFPEITVILYQSKASSQQPCP